jgi:predicted lipoprotein with Yx(FWY)xxD motif
MALVDHQGMTLYTYDKDPPNVPTCTGGCADLWPRLLTVYRPGGAHRYGLEVRREAGHPR